MVVQGVGMPAWPCGASWLLQHVHLYLLAPAVRVMLRQAEASSDLHEGSMGAVSQLYGIEFDASLVGATSVAHGNRVSSNNTMRPLLVSGSGNMTMLSMWCNNS